MANKDYLYYAHTLPGLEKVAWIEIRTQLDRASFDSFTELPGKNGLVLFRYTGQPSDLLKLRTTEDVFFLIARIPKIKWGYQGLSQIYQSLSSSRFLGTGLSVYNRAHGTSGKRKQIHTFRVISRMVGKRHPYRRMDMGRTVEKGLKKRLGSKWHTVEEGEDVEFWANLVGQDFICGLRLSDASMRHRDYKTTHIAASLRPSVAAAMGWLTEPQAADVFLDPMCGAGTLLVERAIIERHTLLLGGDTDKAALRAAAKNIGPKHKPRQLVEWDAGRLPLISGSVTQVATNLPFGKQIGSWDENIHLYRAFFREVDRVLDPKGRVVVLSSEMELIKNTLRKVNGLQIVRGYSVRILGQKARIYLIERPH
ncbi:MAG: methyltransferase domain-containing protein [Chloroflexi bacterium]|nr:methyltransferase domain-containing protein [Chloroflexota bacterium]